MVGNAEMKKLVDDDYFLKDEIFSEEISAEGDASAGRARSPFPGHVLDLDTRGFHADL